LWNRQLKNNVKMVKVYETPHLRHTPTRLQNDRTRNTARRMGSSKTRDVVGIINI